MTSERELMDEIAALAAWQCIHTDGKTGLVNTEHGHQICAKDATIATLTADNERLSARVERLEAALKPFADAVKKRDKTAEYMGFEPSFDECPTDWLFTFGTLRAARRELEEGHD